MPSFAKFALVSAISTDPSAIANSVRDCAIRCLFVGEFANLATAVLGTSHLSLPSRSNGYLYIVSQLRSCINPWESLSTPILPPYAPS